METDEKLIAAANAGDSEAFEALYLRYRDWVYALAMRFTGNGAQAADAVQETFLYLLKKFPGFELRCGMKSFLYPAVRHISITITRQGRRTSSDEALLAELPAPDAAEMGGSQAELAAVLETLAAEQRQVVLMRFVDDMPLADIAEALDLSLNTVKSRLYRALEALRSDSRTRRYFLD
ncbi:MAG: sigma-70 family RNA polymerase sigma factor [Phycisphaerae bacterium]|nr:sigma-70 family RNA polymerase sigma factor [Phycisphaerae bacterium]